MLIKKMIAVYSDNHIKPINTKQSYRLRFMFHVAALLLLYIIQGLTALGLDIFQKNILP
jgi:hypothetical protein